MSQARIIADPAVSPPTSAAVLEIRSPGTGRLIGRVPCSSQGEVQAAAARARTAGQAWATRSFAERRKVLLRARAHLIQHRDELVALLRDETSGLRTDGLTELLALCNAVGYFASQAERQLADRPVSPILFKNKKALITYRPRGVVGVISPWNMPVFLAYLDALAAICAGNGVVIKPSEVAPLAVARTRELLVQGGLPADLLQVVHGRGDVGEHLVDAVDLVCFTGSVETGKKVMARAALRLTPVQLELGGKDPLIVLRDADLERAANAAVFGGLFYSGQGCVSVERVYVEEPVAEAFTAKVVEKVAALRQGPDPEDPGDAPMDLGAMTFAPQLERLERQLRDAVARGATIRTGGGRRADLPGQCFAPTVVTGVTHEMELMREETFGPILPIMTVKDAEEALRLANDSRYGLAASLFTGDKDRGVALARRLETGGVCVNDCLATAFMNELPFGGVKESGVGSRCGPEGLRSLCHATAIVIDRFGARREPHWLPRPRWLGAAVDRVLGLFFGR